MTLTPGKVNQGTPGPNASPWPVSLQGIAAGTTLAIVGNTLAPQTGAWTSATALNTAVTVSGCGPYGAANVAINVPSTITAGVVTLEVSHDGTTYYPAGAVRIDNSYAENVISLAYAPGINGNRNYLISLDAFTNVRARLSTVITGTGTVNVALVVGQQGVEPLVATRTRKAPTYHAFYRTTTRAYALDFTFTANTRKQYATIHHAASATKTVRLRRVRFWPYANLVAASDLRVDLVRLTTAPATGNPAITPTPADTGDPVAEATCLALPTTAGTEGALLTSVPVPVGITGAASTANPPSPGTPVDLLNLANYDDEAKMPTIRAGVLEGWAISLDSNAANRFTGFAEIEFTEEAP